MQRGGHQLNVAGLAEVTLNQQLSSLVALGAFRVLKAPAAHGPPTGRHSRRAVPWVHRVLWTLRSARPTWGQACLLSPLARLQMGNPAGSGTLSFRGGFSPSSISCSLESASTESHSLGPPGLSQRREQRTVLHKWRFAPHALTRTHARAHTRPHTPRTRISYGLANRATPVRWPLRDRPLLRGGNLINRKGLLQPQGKQGRRPAEASFVSSAPAAPQGLPRVNPSFLDRRRISFLHQGHSQA